MKKKSIDKRKIKYDAIDLDKSLTKWIIPRLKWLEKNAMSYPEDLSEEEWIEILKEIREGFEAYNIGLDYTEKFKKSLELLSKYYMDLWS